MTSYTSQELEQKNKEVEELLGFKPFELVGNNIMVKMYLRDEVIKTIEDTQGNTNELFWTDLHKDVDRYNHPAGMVVQISKTVDATKLSYKIGDWLTIARNEGTAFFYGTHLFHILPANKIFSILKEPYHIERKLND